MALAVESEALHLCESLQSLLIARGRNEMSAWYTANVSGALALEIQRAQACVPKLAQALLEAEQWYAGDVDAVTRVEDLKASLESLIASAL